MRYLGSKGLSMTQARSVSNICNQNAEELDRYFREDLTSSMNRTTDIVAVYAPKVTNSFPNLLKEDPGSLIWPKPAVEKTVEEIEKELNMVPGTLRIKK